MSSPQEASIASHLPLSPRDFHILFALSDSNRHGYGLVRAIEHQSSGLVRLDPANLYRAVQKLAAAGLVADAERAPAGEADGERRRYYRITELGREVLVADVERLRGLADAAVAKRLVAPRSELR